MPETALASSGQTDTGAQAGSDQSTGSQQTQGTTWRDTLPSEIRNEKSFDVFKGEKWEEVGPVIAKSFLEAQKMIGGSIKIPGKDAKPEEINAFYKKLGRPDKPEDYQWKKPEFISPDVRWDDEMAKEFLNVAHQIGLNNNQVQALIDWQGKLMEGRAVNVRQQINSAIAELKKEWGTDFDKNIKLGERAVREIGGEPLVRLLEETGLGNNTILVKAFARIGEVFAEDGFIDGRVEGTMSRDEIKAKLEAMLMDKNHPINDLSHPGHKTALEEYTKLNEMYVRAKK